MPNSFHEYIEIATKTLDQTLPTCHINYYSTNFFYYLVIKSTEKPEFKNHTFLETLCSSILCIAINIS